MRRLTLLLLLGSAGSAFATCPNATPAQIEAQKAKALAAPSATSREEEGYLRIRIPQQDSVVTSFFTLPSHPAHPSNVVSVTYSAEGKVWLYSRGFTAGNCAAFEQWMQGFADLHKRVQESFRPKPGT